MNAIGASFWGSVVGLFLVLALVFVAVFLVASMLVGSREKRKREKALAARLGRGKKEGEEGGEAVSTQWVPTQFAEAGQRFAVATGYSASLDERLEQAGVNILAGEYVAITVLCALGGALFAGLLVQNIIFVLLIAAFAGTIPYFWVARAHRKRQNLLVDQLADTLSILASSLRAGYSFLQALDTVSKEIGEPSAHEFQRVVAEIRLGRPIDDALTAMAARINSDDLKWAVIAINVQRQVGGNLAEVLDIVAATVRERGYLRRQVRVLSAEGTISVAILASIPFVIMLYLGIVNREYISLLFTRTVGLAMLAFAAILMTLGIWIMTRIVKIDV
jgi:tight adherence protein B